MQTGGHMVDGDYVYDAGSTGCWRWWGQIHIPRHEWSHIAVQYDGTNEKHYVNGMLAETGTKPTPLLTTVLPSRVDWLPQARAPATPLRAWRSTRTRRTTCASARVGRTTARQTIPATARRATPHPSSAAISTRLFSSPRTRRPCRSRMPTSITVRNYRGRTSLACTIGSHSAECASVLRGVPRGRRALIWVPKMLFTHLF